ncbi:mechanosensitive ion channel family protein [Pelagicoccus sp. SDUM812005]|uniref:mechanosensitive ion channel family protein n=1 Tax=Pelagicoccus sp. SDUM812005 TaxID=3041257 RepID=UPI00280D09B7|nr:mechanosensitive ion channel family protein [Pelagicoccus sp. SDUM812005]MDQ8181749.1 mechanosensitive ion channel family protein [Pelagicoccus sp. SDUM812005]
MNDTSASFEDAYHILIEKLASWYELLVAHLPNAVAALVIFAIFFALASIGRRVTKRLFARAFDTGAIAQLVSTILKILILFLGLFIGLGVLGLQKTVLSLLAGAGIVGIALGFAFQDLAENLIAGITMGIRKPFKNGDLIETHGELGHVESLNLRNSILVNFSGQRIIIPNKEVFQNKLINYSQTGARRIELEVGVSFDSDLEAAAEVAKEAIRSRCGDWLHPHKDVEAFAIKFGESSIHLTVRYWIKFPGSKSYFAAIHDGVTAILAAYREHDIEIPFPIRTLQTGDTLSLNIEKREAAQA